MLQTMGQGSSSLRGEETRRGHGPQQAPEAQGDVPGRKGPRASAWPCPPPHQHHCHAQRRPQPRAPAAAMRVGADGNSSLSAQDTCHREHSPLEFWELLFVSSKWFCALLSTLRLKALSAGWGQERARENDGD